MKELYTTPEVKLLCFAPVQQLASVSKLDLDEALGGTGTDTVSNVLPDVGDIDITISL